MAASTSASSWSSSSFTRGSKNPWVAASFKRLMIAGDQTPYLSSLAKGKSAAPTAGGLPVNGVVMAMTPGKIPGGAAKEADSAAVTREALVAAFLTGIKGLNQPVHVNPSEMLRLNTSIAPTPPARQNDLGILGGDLAGFPNGRRPYDDVVDITLRVAEGAACGVIGNCGSETKDPNNGAPYTDGVRAAGPDAAHVHVSGKINPDDVYLSGFPYLDNPLPGSPQGALE